MSFKAWFPPRRFHRRGQRNLIAPDSSPNVRCQRIPTNWEHSVLSSSSFRKKFFFKLSAGDIGKVIVASSETNV